MHALNRADELADVRAEIARLEIREQALRDGFIKRPQADIIGRWTRADATATQKSRFDSSLLPDVIRNDPAYFRHSATHFVRCLPTPMIPKQRAGWPIRRDADARQ